MSSNQFIREKKEDKPVIAICYDFDKTLSPDDMQAQGFIQSVGYDIAKFWNESNSLASANDMDQNLAYMYKMVQESEGNLLFKKGTLANYGSQISLFPGVDNWFNRIQTFGKEHNVIIEHYIISSGLKEMIEGTSIASSFKKIYASSFYYNDKGIAKWPAQVVNYTNKTQFLFRIEKGVLDVNDPGVNDYFKPEEIRVPFRNFIYIGDSDTDVPCMKLVNVNGGHSIGVFNPKTNDKNKVYKMVRDQRIKYFVPADYNANTELDNLVKNIIIQIAANEKLVKQSLKYKNETDSYINSINEDEIKRNELIISLEDSSSYRTTHTIVSSMRKIQGWTHKQQLQILNAIIKNPQINGIITDVDIKRFAEQFADLLPESAESKKIYELLKSSEE